MPNNKCSNSRNKNKETNETSPKEHTSVLECEDEETDEMPETEFKKLIIGLLRSNQKQIYKLKKSIHDMNENFPHEIEILKRNQNEILEMKNSIDQIEMQWKALTTELVRQKKEYPS